MAESSESTESTRHEWHPLLRIWAPSTAVIFCLCAAWSLATPIGAAQDEPAQLVKAASVVRGEFVGRAPSPKSVAGLSATYRRFFQVCPLLLSADLCTQPYTIVKVPESFADLAIPSCYRFSPDVPAGCAPGFRGAARETTTVTYVGRYPPLYYAIVGLPSLVWHSDLAVYLMRLLSGLLSALFLGLAIALAVTWSRSRLLVLALAVTVTPMVIIFGSVVNPSGLEMATAVCVWTGGLVLVLDRSNRPPPSLVAATAASAAAMVLIRGLSPLWLVVIAAFIFSLRPRSLSELIRSPSVRWSAVAVVVAGVAATTYILWAHALSLTYVGAVSKGTSEVGVIELALGRTLGLVNEFVGTIGWVQSSPPLAVIGLWVLPASTVVLAGLVASLRRHVIVLVGIMIASFVLPTALMASQARGAGVGVWQARDGFPLYAGIVLVSGAVAGRGWQPSWDYPGATATVRMVLRRLPLLVAICVGAAQIGEFVWALRRYSVGLGATVNPFAHVPGGWSPPISSVGLVIFMTTTAFVYSWWIVMLGRRALEARSPSPERSTISVSAEWELAAPSDA